MLKLCTACNKHYFGKCSTCGANTACDECGCRTCQVRADRNAKVTQIAPTRERKMLVRIANRKQNPNFAKKKFFRKKRRRGYRPDWYDMLLNDDDR